MREPGNYSLLNILVGVYTLENGFPIVIFAFPLDHVSDYVAHLYITRAADAVHPPTRVSSRNFLRYGNRWRACFL